MPEPYEIFDADKLILFAQAMLRFAPPPEGGMSSLDALELLKGDHEEREALYDLYINAYKLYIHKD